jgi:hypothetical protein
MTETTDDDPPPASPDPKLAEACRLVGEFQYHYGRIEQKIDQGVIKLLVLDDKAGRVFASAIDFAKKLNLLWTVAHEQARDDNGQAFVDNTCKAVFAVNMDRQNVIHASFEPAPTGGVQSKRTVAKEGRVKAQNPVWDDKKFKQQYTKMKQLADDLDKLIDVVRPVQPADMSWFMELSRPIHSGLIHAVNAAVG